jgi:uncharacterized protein with HEPN domain
MPESLEYLRHILDEARYLAGQTESLTKEQFLEDETLKRAFARSLEIIGEAAKKVSDELKAAHPGIEWRAMAGMREVLVTAPVAAQACGGVAVGDPHLAVH